MSKWIYLKATSNEMSALFEQDFIGIKYFTKSEDKQCDDPKLNIYQVEIRGHDEELTAFRTYTTQGLLRRFKFEYKLGCKPFIRFVIFDKGKQLGIVSRHIMQNQILNTAECVMAAVRLFFPDAYIGIYREVNDKKSKIMGSVAPEGTKFDTYIKH